MTNEQVWQFHVVGRRQFDMNGTTYFTKRANQMAETLGCRVLSVKHCVLQNSPGDNWMVTGTAVLETVKANA